MNANGAVVLQGTAVEEVLKRGPVRGHVLRGEPGGKVSLVPWYLSARVPAQGTSGPETWNPRLFVQNVPVPEHARQQMIQGLPSEIRRTPRERKRALVMRLIEDVRRAHVAQAQGLATATFPKSIADDITQAGWVVGVPNLLHACSQGQPWALSVYADHLMLKAAGQQKVKDAKRSTIDWHGHDNSSIQIRTLTGKRT